jgi:hypothetical protein
VTAIRDRQSDPDADDVSVPWDERPIVGARRGLPWWGAVLVGFGVAILGAVLSLQMSNSLGLFFQVCYFLGAVGAACGVQRRSLFGPMVQPPLVLAITVPGVVLLASGTPSGSDTLSKAIDVGTPLINGFPTMAITTGVTLAIGLARYYREPDPDAPKKIKNSAAAKRVPIGTDSSRGGRTATADREGRGRGAAGKPGRPAPGRADAPPRRSAADVGGEGRGRPAEDRPRRARPASAELPARGGQPAADRVREPRKPRAPRPAEGDARRREPRDDGGRRTPPPRSRDPRTGDPRRTDPNAPRRRGAPRARPWDEEG